MNRSLCVLAVMLAACQQKPTPLPSQLHAVPFQRITDVQMGMSAQDFAQHRPAARSAGQEYHEQVASYDVVYEFVNDKLAVISSTEYDNTGIAALIRYKRYVGETTRSLDVEPACRYSKQRNTIITEYQLKGEVFELLYQMGDPSAASIITRSFRTEPSPLWYAGVQIACVH